MNIRLKHVWLSAFLLVSVAATAQVQVGGSVFGGGNLANVTGNSTVTVNQANASIGEDVYGGGALADVKSSSTVNVLNGNVTGNVYGGGLGRKGDDPIAPTVDGVVTVNIGSGTENTTTHFANNDVSGSATIGGSVFGCNNANGSPTDDVFVNIWKTAHTSGVDEVDDDGYALYQVFGGGNQANYEPSSSNKKTTVHIWTCDNTIQYVYGGGNAADVGTSSTNSATDVIIDGGRIEWVFGGGNGAGASNPGANIFGGVNVDYHAGQLTYLFGGSNEKGNISGSKTVNIINDGTCSNNHITELYGGSNLAPITGDVSLTMGCRPSNDPVEIGSLFGGSRNANITGNVTLTIEGGEYAEVFGGNNMGGTISGDVTLNLFGGTIGSAFGGNNAGGFINGKITVNMLDQGSCGLTVNNIYGGGKNAAYLPTTPGAYPEVNLIHGTVSKNTGVGGNVYGGGYGSSATVTSNPTVNIGYNSTTMTSLVSSLLLPPSTSLTTANVDVKGNVYGGGEEAPVAGSTSVTMQQASVSGLTANTNVRGDIYGGGNEADVSRSVVVNVTGGTVTQDVYGGGALADVNVTSGALTSGATTAVTLSGGQARALYGGGLGSRETGSEVEAKVYGPVTVIVNDGTVTDVFGCNNQNGAPQNTVTVNINNNVAGNVYGGGNLAAYTGTPDVNINAGTVSGSVFGGGNQAGVGGGDVTMTGGTVLTGIYGGCNTSGTVSNNIVVSLTGGTIGAAAVGTPGEAGYVAEQRANVHGGGYGQDTKTGGNVEVTIDQQSGENPPAAPVIWGDVYGGSALGSVNSSAATPAVNSSSHTYVTLNKGTVHGDIYGGGLGETTPSNIEAKVWSPVQVTVNGGMVTGSVYGCNNKNGAPQNTVKVDIYGTDTPASGYALANVFGGGNLAAYGGTPDVTIHNCDNSIGFVYGGGNAASVAATNVVVYGGNTIGYVFGGGNGTGVAANFEMVSGNAVANIYGGTIDHVFGGNNSSGAITGTISVNINKQTETSHPSCPMKIGEVYGGGNQAAGNAGTITIGCTGTLASLGSGEHYGVDQEGIRYVYGGANQADISNSIVLNINSGIIENVFGGNNTSGSITGTIQVNINKNDNATCANNWYVGDVYGGGNHAAYSGSPDVNIQNGTVSGNVFGGGNDITTANAGILNSDVEMTGGTVLGGVYGGCNEKGSVTGNSVVSILGGIIGSSEKLNNNNTTDVFGGGLGVNTKVNGNVTVSVSRATGENPPAAPTIYGDVYGGSALGEVNYNDYNASTPTTSTKVNILDGLLKSNRVQTGTNAASQPIYSYTGGNVFGGGKGRKTGTPVLAKVYGPVSVNIGNGNPSTTEDGENFTGNATIEGNIYGCNNANGSPQQNVTVNIYRTAHTDGTPNNTVEGDAYALANVFGGGNEADFQVSGKTATINIYGCKNTIARTFGGGNAAASNEVFTMIQGGRIGEVFSGGNGEVSAANVNGNVNLTIHGGNIGQTFGGSNQQGFISGDFISVFDDNGPCGPMDIEDHYCGGKFADYEGNINATMTCSGGMNVRNLYGGCKQAHVVPKPAENAAGNVTLTVYGGTFENIYGGSEGTPSVGADIAGNVTLNVYGGTVTHAIFGGSNIKGAIGGTITVNVEDKNTTDDCPLDVSEADVYGGGNVADYPGVPESGGPITNNPIPNPGNYPVVTIKNATVKNVFGGGLNAEVTGNPQVLIKKGAKVRGNVYGGGNMGQVNGSPRVIVNGNLQ